MIDSDKYPRLNVPAADMRIRPRGDAGAEVYDRWRRRWVALTPEEWVRQHFVSMLVTECGYVSGRVANEVSIKLNNTARRCDTVIYDSSMRPWMIVEYKAPDVRVTQETFDQIVRYNMVLKARYLVVSNGLVHFCCEISYETRSYRFLPEIPAYNV